MLKELMTEVNTKTSPAVKLLHKNNYTKVLAIAFKENMLLKEHKSPGLAHLVVMQGKVEYRSKNEAVILDCYDEMNIPGEDLHSVLALEDALIILIIDLI